MTVAWWSEYYPVRRNIKITPKLNDTILTGHPIYCFYEYNDLVTLKKMRSDFEDLEILHFTGDATPIWTKVARQVAYDTVTGLISVLFNAVEDITEVDTHYYVHMANSDLIDFAQRPEYESAVYVLTVTPQSNTGLMFTRPGEDWHDGVSTTPGAKASLTFLGVNLKLTVEKGPDKGILEIKLDDDEAIIVDCYAINTSNEIIYEVTNLSKETHNLRITVSGNKSASSSGTAIKIVSMGYSKYIEGKDQGEEFDALYGSFNAIVGL